MLFSVKKLNILILIEESTFIDSILKFNVLSYSSISIKKWVDSVKIINSSKNKLYLIISKAWKSCSDVGKDKSL